MWMLPLVVSVRDSVRALPTNLPNSMSVQAVQHCETKCTFSNHTRFTDSLQDGFRFLTILSRHLTTLEILSQCIDLRLSTTVLKLLEFSGTWRTN
jgi:hypothetical protein